MFPGNAVNQTNKRRHKTLIIAVTVAAGTIILAVCAFLAICACHSWKRNAKHSGNQAMIAFGKVTFEKKK